MVQQRLNLAEDRVPLLVVLRDLDTGQTIRAALEQAVRYVLQLSDADPVAGWLVDHWERTNRLLILLDGLDEARDQDGRAAPSPTSRHRRWDATRGLWSPAAALGTFRLAHRSATTRSNRSTPLPKLRRF